MVRCIINKSHLVNVYLPCFINATHAYAIATDMYCLLSVESRADNIRKAHVKF